MYESDGAGSGSWEFQKPTNLVIVESASDLPAASGGIRTLAANTTYQIVGQVSIGTNRITFSDKSALIGLDNEKDELVGTTSGIFLTMTDKNTLIRNLKITCTNGTLWDIDGTGAEIVSIRDANITCDTIGDINNLYKFNVFKTVIDAESAGMTFTGAFTEFHCFDSTVDVATTNATCIDLGTATFDHCHLFNVEFKNPSGTGYGFDVAASGANINSGGLGIVANTTFSTAANATNYVEGAAKWEKLGTPGMLPTTAKAQGYVDGNANANTFGGGVGVAEAVNFGTSFLADTQHKFTISTGGRFTYNGTSETVVMVTATARVTMGGGASRVRNLYIAKNGTKITSSIQSKALDGTNEGTYSTKSFVTLSNSNYIELFIEAETSTTSTTVDTASITVVEVK